MALPALMRAQLNHILAVESPTTVRLDVVVPRDLSVHGFTHCDDQAVIVEFLAHKDISGSPEAVTACFGLLDRFERAAYSVRACGG
ncbi:hypothetical protein ACWDR0_27995 [Streptomyces sp. NPDC003691]